MKKLVCLLTAAVLAAAFCSCSSSGSSEKQTESSSRTQSASQANYRVSNQFVHAYKYGGETKCCAVVEVTNTGDADIDLADINFNFTDASGKPVEVNAMKKTAPMVTKPGKKGYFYVDASEAFLSANANIDDGVKIKPEVTVKATSLKVHDFPVANDKMKLGEDGSVTVTGTVRNDLDSQRNVVVAVLFHDAVGKVVAVADDYTLPEIAAGKKADFEVSTPKESSREIAERIRSYTVIACG